MKYWIAFLIFLSSSSVAFACGPWYPYGEDTRFSLLYPGWFDNGALANFYYSAEIIAETSDHTAYNDRNILDWWNLLDQEIEKELIFETIYGWSTKAIIDGENQPMIKALLRKKGKAFLDYLIFAKSHSHLNSKLDYWEREEEHNNSMREEAAKKALTKVKNSKDQWLKRRYAFLALRFYFYNDNKAKVIELFDEYFDGKNEWAIDQWAEYHRLHFEENSAKRNWRVAQLFETVQTKRFGLWRLFNKRIDKPRVLELAKTDEEKANVHAMYLLREKGKTLEELKTIHQLNPNNELLSFYILREINKLENWVLGPEITAHQPLISPYISGFDVNDKIIKERIAQDRLYAAEFLNWIANSNLKINPELQTASVAVLSLVIQQPKIGLKELGKQRFSTNELNNWKNNMTSLLQARQSKNPKLKSLQLDSLLIKNGRNKDAFLFAIGREFEFSGELHSAMILYSYLNKGRDYRQFTWSESNGQTAYNLDYYSSGFDYFDANYSAAEVDRNWQKIGELKDTVLASKLLNKQSEWLDMIGTKYLREEQIEKSIAIWAMVPNTYWNSSPPSYDYYLNANPFYANFYSRHQPTVGDTVSYTKPEIAQELQKRIQLSKKLEGDAKAKVLFGIANCYFNMTQYGNSWMMKRYYWTMHEHNTIYADNEDFNKCINAEKYYIKAKEAANSKKFQALCLRMAGRCESLRRGFSTEYADYNKDQYDSYRDYLFQKNQYYKQLKARYPENQEELLTNCMSFDRYYNSIQ